MIKFKDSVDGVVQRCVSREKNVREPRHVARCERYAGWRLLGVDVGLGTVLVE